MMRSIQALSVLLPVLYALCALLHGFAFAGQRSLRFDNLRRNLFRVALCVHLTLFVVRGIAIAQFPIDDLWTTVSAVAFSMAVSYGLVARITDHPGSGGVTLGLVFLAQLLASSLGSFEPHAHPGGMSAWAVSHVTMSTIAAAALVLSGVHGLLYILLFREMRGRKFGRWFSHLPDLDLLAKMTRRSALIGFIGLTVGLNVGIGLAHAEHAPGFNYHNPEVLLSLVLWVHFGVIAFSEKIRGFGARRASYAAAGGLVAVLLSLFLVLLPHSFHSRL